MMMTSIMMMKTTLMMTTIKITGTVVGVLTETNT